MKNAAKASGAASGTNSATGASVGGTAVKRSAAGAPVGGASVGGSLGAPSAGAASEQARERGADGEHHFGIDVPPIMPEECGTDPLRAKDEEEVGGEVDIEYDVATRNDDGTPKR